MPKIFLIGATAGISTSQGPVGGGVRIFEQLRETIPLFSSQKLITLSAHPQFSRNLATWGEEIHIAVDILKPFSSSEAIIHLSEIQYSRFALQFEKEVTRFLLQEAEQGDILLINDISEGPHFQKLAQAGFVVVPLFHIAVAEFFCKLYLKNFFSAPTLVKLTKKLEKYHCAWLVPKLLQLVFVKERQAVQAGTRLIVPSEGLRKALLNCYGPSNDSKIQVVPWNLHEPDPFSPEMIEEKVLQLRLQYKIQPHEKIWMTLSRISWEKGLEQLFDALDFLPPEYPFRLFICGEAAYMGGQKYLAQLQKRAKRFGQSVLFTGYVHGLNKRAFFQMADRFISTSHYEAYGLTLQEAIQRQVPVLSFDHHGARQHQSQITLISGKNKYEKAKKLAQALQEEPPKETVPLSETLPSAAEQIIQGLQKIRVLPEK